MEREKTLEIVKKAYDLEVEKAKAQDEYTRLINEVGPVCPLKPKKKIVKKGQYPIAEDFNQYKNAMRIFWTLTKLLLFVFFIYIFWILVAVLTDGYDGSGAFAIVLTVLFVADMIAGVVLSSVIKDKIEKSPEYLDICRRVDSYYQDNIKKADEEYATAMNQFEMDVREYQKAREKWEREHSLSIDIAKATYDRICNSLNNHYNSTSIIPNKYHDIDILEYLYDILCSSQYSLKEAIEDYERSEQRKIDILKIQEQRRTNKLTEQQNYLLDEQNDLIDEQNEIAYKTRRDMNIANTIQSIQLHNISRNTKNISNK